MQSAANALRLPNSFDRTATTVSDETKLTAQADAGAPRQLYGTGYSISQSASDYQQRGQGGCLHHHGDRVRRLRHLYIQKSEAVNQTVTLNDGATLDDLRSAINDLGAGVTASVINTGTTASPAYRLTSPPLQPGVNAVTVVTDTTSLDLTNASGSGGSTLQAGQNAIVVIGEPDQTTISIERESNVISDAIPDVTLTLKSKTVTTPTPEPVTVNVTTDPESVSNIATWRALTTIL